MKRSLFAIIFLLIVFKCAAAYSQARPSLQFTAGLSFPGDKFGGELVSQDFYGNININESYIKSNYAVSTGASITGTLKFPLMSSGIMSALILGSYNSFNTFRQSYLGTTIVQSTTIPVDFDNRFSASTFALGIEFSPIPASKISPFINANYSFNILSTSLIRSSVTTVIFSDAFRMGLLYNAGINFRLNTEYSIVLGGSYHLSNLFLKSQSSDFSQRVVYNSDGAPINDKGGTFFSNLTNPNTFPQYINGETKEVNWWGVNLGLSILLGKSSKK